MLSAMVLTHSSGKRVLLFAVVSTLAGCCPSRFDRPAGEVPTADVAIDRMRAHVSKVESFEFLTRMSYYGETGARKGRVELLGRAPATFRMEALTPSDDTVAILISDGERFVSHERGQTTCYTGAACADNVSKLLPVSLEGPDLYAVLVGGAPVIVHDEATVEWDECEGLWKVILREKASAQQMEIWLRPDTGSAMKARLSDTSGERFVITWDDFETTDGVNLPRTLRFTSPIGDTDLEVEIREAWLNQVKDTGDVFVPQCPPGTRGQELLCR